VLNAVYEADFLGFCYGLHLNSVWCRPGDRADATLAAIHRSTVVLVNPLLY
jgi:hypothetical protein